MSGTARTPLGRRSTLPQVTHRALALFEDMEKVRRRRRRASCRVSELSGYCDVKGFCPACKMWWDLHGELHSELRLKPWQWPCVPRNPFPPGSPGARAWRASTEEEQLWNLLHAAAMKESPAGELRGE